MKISLLLFAAWALVVVGCGKSADESAPASTNAAASSGNPLTAPVDYLNSAAKAKHSADKTVDAAALSKAVDMFNVQEGRYPKDLDELVTKKYIPQIPTPPVGMKIEYDAKTGTVKVVKQ
jgi:hypothetical protein